MRAARNERTRRGRVRKSYLPVRPRTSTSKPAARNSSASGPASRKHTSRGTTTRGSKCLNRLRSRTSAPPTEVTIEHDGQPHRPIRALARPHQLLQCVLGRCHACAQAEQGFDPRARRSTHPMRELGVGQDVHQPIGESTGVARGHEVARRPVPRSSPARRRPRCTPPAVRPP